MLHFAHENFLSECALTGTIITVTGRKNSPIRYAKNYFVKEERSMNHMGEKIAAKRKACGLTQIEFAEKLSVTRQTVSRWEAGTVMPDIDKLSDIASILGVSCDYLLKDDIGIDAETSAPAASAIPGKILSGIVGKKVKLNFCDDEIDVDLYDLTVTVDCFEGNWMKVSAQSKKGATIEKLVPLASILSFEIVKE